MSPAKIVFLSVEIIAVYALAALIFTLTVVAENRARQPGVNAMTKNFAPTAADCD